jgi:hypothetical protein
MRNFSGWPRAIRVWLAYAASRLPAWLWTADGKRILWANPAGVRLFGAASAAALAEKTFGPADRHRRQVARLAGRLLAGGTVRLERLQGFGAAPGGLRDLRLLAVRLSRWQPRRSDRRRQHRADRAAPRRRRRPTARCSQAATSSEPPSPAPVLSEPIVQPSAPVMPVIEQPVAPQPAADDRQPAPSGEASAGFALFDAFAEPAAADEPPAVETIPPATGDHCARPSPAIEALAGQPQARRVPMRFTWQMDRESRFTLGSDEFKELIGPRTTAAFGRPWREIAETFGFDPTGRMMQAFATGVTWSGITLNWPVDGGGTLPIELSGLPVFDAARNFIGYRGIGVCRDFDAIARLAALRFAELSGEMTTPQELSAAPTAETASAASPSSDELPEPIAAEILAAETSAQRPSHQKIWKRPWNLPRKPPRKAVRGKTSGKVKTALRTSPGMRPTEAAMELAGRDCRANVLPFRAPGRREAAGADAG